MPALYVANPTNQQQVVMYRLDYERDGSKNESRHFQMPRQQNVMPGCQALLGERDFHQKQVESIIEQLQRYGLVMTDDLGAVERDKRITYVGRVGLPIAENDLRRAVFHNTVVKTEEGRIRRESAAVATNELVQQAVQQHFLQHQIPADPSTDTSIAIEQIDEVEGAETAPIAEGFDVVPEGEVGRHSGRPAAKRKRRRK